MKKGGIPWNKGLKGAQVAWNKGVKMGPMSDSEKLKRSIALKGRPSPLRGITLTDQHKLHLSKSLTGIKRTPEQKERYSKAKWKRGTALCSQCKKPTSGYRKRTNPLCGECYKKVLRTRRGDMHPLWKGGSGERHLLMGQSEYIAWRASIFDRDDYRCFDCGQRGGNLEAHHIYPFAKYPRLRLESQNGVTLCLACHNQTKRKVITIVA